MHTRMYAGFGGERIERHLSEFLEHLASDNGADMHKYNTLCTHTLYWHVLATTSYRIKHKNIAFESAARKPLFQKRYFGIKGKI